MVCASYTTSDALDQSLLSRSDVTRTDTRIVFAEGTRTHADDSPSSLCPLAPMKGTQSDLTHRSTARTR